VSSGCCNEFGNDLRYRQVGGQVTQHADLAVTERLERQPRPGQSRRYHIPPGQARTIAALIALYDQVIAPIIAGIPQPPRRGRKPPHWTRVDPDYETPASACRACSTTSASPPSLQLHRQHFVDRRNASA
jgi:hypothetical protein